MKRIVPAAAVISTILLGASLWSHAADWLSGRMSMSDILLWADQTVINTTILMMLAVVVSRRLELVWIPILLAAGEAVYDNRVLITGLHSLLLQIDTYRELLGRHATTQVNPQYAMVTAYVVSFTILTGTCILRRWRSFDRAAVLVMAASVMATFTLFHTFLMVGILREAAAEGRAIRTALVTESSAFETTCGTLGLECSQFTLAAVASGEADADPLAATTLSDLARQGTRLAEPFIWDGATDDDASRTIFFIIGVASDAEGFRVARSRMHYEEATKFEELRYTAQALAAHATWMGLACALIAIHRRHARPRIRRLFSEESFR